MAKMTVEAGDELSTAVERLEASMRRGGIRRIVEAGARVAIDEMRAATEAHHVRTGNMRDAVGMAEYHETLEGGSVNVYPQGTDSRGVRNAMKAFVINYGIGANPTRRSRGRREANKTGDKFITGQFNRTRPRVQEAMETEAHRIFEEAQNGGKQ